jgi:hypothetical protein
VVEWPLHYSFSLKMESVLHFESWPSTRLCSVMFQNSHAIAQAISHQLTTTVTQVLSGHVESVVDEVTLVWVFSEYSGKPWEFSFHLLPVINHHNMTLQSWYWQC